MPESRYALFTEEPKRAFRLLEPAFSDLPAQDPVRFFAAAIQRTAERFGSECGIVESGLFETDAGGWSARNGAPVSLLAALPSDLGVHSAARGEGAVFRSEPFPAAIWRLGPRREWLAIFRLSAPAEERPALILEMARMAAVQKAQEGGWNGVIDRARDIQRSLLPERPAQLPGIAIAARSEPAEQVGGDAFDVISLAPDALGLMISDASGHGLPAALEARDVVIGLRMGAARQLKIHSTIERLNRILCASTLSSRFVSLVYGELDSDGSFDYVNAGHPAPLVLTSTGEARLDESGPVLGVLPDSRYRVGHARLPEDGMLVLFTDGITECPSPDGEEFGTHRLVGVLRGLIDAPPALLCAAVFDALADHAQDPRTPDDATLLIARRGRASTS
ncbi:MAG: PP2C family protein-serine/threonine phosphatase [Acidobacteriota bacterium]